VPGLKIVVGAPGASLPPLPEPEAIAPEVHRRRGPVFSAPGIDVSFDVPDDYPSFTFAGDEFFLFVEGLIYDRSDEDLVRLGTVLAGRVAAGEPLDEDVLDFLRRADGEFVVLLVHEPSGTLVVFNDLWGRLPLYSAQTSSQVVLSREPVEILPYLPEIRFDRKALVEWMALEYTLNDRWFVEGVEPAAPATLFVISTREGKPLVARRALAVRDLTASDPIRNRQEAAGRYVDLCLRGYAARAEKLGRLGYRLTSDLSGGFDSRLLLAGARRLQVPMEFFTDDLVSGDESATALRVAELCGASATRVPRPAFVRDAAEWRRWTYLTGGRVNAPTMMGALLVTRARRAMVTGKTARFMGFAGEPFRNPPLPAGGHGGFAGALADDVYTRYIGFRDGCGLTGLDWGEYQRHLSDTVAAWPERDFASRCRRFDRRRDLGTVHAGEDRHRWHFWTATPMWSSYVLDYAYRSVGPGMANYAFFTEILRTMYPRVLEVPIHRRPFPLDSRSAMLAVTRQGELRTRARQHRLVRRLRQAMGDPEKWAARPAAEERAWIGEQAQAALRESPAARATFDPAAVARYLGTQNASHRLYQLLTALWFVAEVEGRFQAACPFAGLA
jgi:asparagine synthase (glutamine-hydrolysing)